MAVLTTAERTDVRDTWMRENNEVCSITKADLIAAINATDDWIDTNAAAYNLALPLASRNGLSARQKAWLFFFVTKKRFTRL